jgi:hypothetical protein
MSAQRRTRGLDPGNPQRRLIFDQARRFREGRASLLRFGSHD